MFFFVCLFVFKFYSSVVFWRRQPQAFFFFFFHTGDCFRLKVPFSCKLSEWILLALVLEDFLLGLQGHTENNFRNLCLCFQWESEDSNERVNVQSLRSLFSILPHLSWSVVPIMMYALDCVRSSPSLLLYRDFADCLEVHKVNAFCSEMKRNEHGKTFQ